MTGVENNSSVELMVTLSSSVSKRQRHSGTAVNATQTTRSQEGGSDNTLWPVSAKRERKHIRDNICRPCRCIHDLLISQDKDPFLSLLHRGR